MKTRPENVRERWHSTSLEENQGGRRREQNHDREEREYGIFRSHVCDRFANRHHPIKPRLSRQACRWVAVTQQRAEASSVSTIIVPTGGIVIQGLPRDCHLRSRLMAGFAAFLLVVLFGSLVGISVRNAGDGPLVGGHLPFEVQTTASGFVKMGIAIDNGPAGSPDSVWARDGSIINEADGSFKMWYVGSDGAQWRILLATSSDGILWTKHGAVVTYTPTVSGPFVLREGATYHMWFQGGPSGGGAIYHATSFNGVNWTVDGVALSPAAGGWDSVQVGLPWVVHYGNQYLLYYAASDGAVERIGLALSSTYVGFTRLSTAPILTAGPGGSWDSYLVRTPAVSPGTPWIMYYAGTDGGSWQIGVATSTDGTSWTRTGTPVLSPGPPPSWDSQGTVGGKFVDGTFGRRLYYTAADGATVRIGLANRDSSSAPPTNPPAAPPTETTSLMSSWRILALVSVVATDASIAIAWFFWFKKTRNLTKQLWQPFPPPQVPPESGRLP